MPGGHNVGGDAGTGLFDIIILALEEAETLEVTAIVVFFDELVSGHQVLDGVLGDGDAGEGEIEVGQKPKSIYKNNQDNNF